MKLHSPISLPASWAYRAAVNLRNGLYSRAVFEVHRLSVPVISVGNITLGGNGKTPLTAFLARHFLGRGLGVAILSRGYRRRSGGRFLVVSDGQELLAAAPEAGDEPVELARTAPGAIVAVGADRFRVAQEVLAEYEARLILLDDGFQHRRLHRDLDLVCVDAGEAPDSLRLLPAGRLREPLEALSRSDALIWTRASERRPEAPLRSLIEGHLPPGTAIFHARLETSGFRSLSGAEALPRDAFRDRAVGLLVAIARPERFAEEIERIGARVVWTETRRDHHYWTRAEVAAAAARARTQGAEAILTTGKDAVKILPPPATDLPLFSVDLRLEVGEGDAFARFVASRIKLDGI